MGSFFDAKKGCIIFSIRCLPLYFIVSKSKKKRQCSQIHLLSSSLAAQVLFCQKNRLKYSKTDIVFIIHKSQGNFILMYKYIITKITYRKVEFYMTKTVQANDRLKNNREQFEQELKMFINQKLFDKHIISEDMYFTAKELLLKKAG